MYDGITNQHSLAWCYYKMPNIWYHYKYYYQLKLLSHKSNIPTQSNLKLSVKQHFFTVPAIPIPNIGGPFLWLLCSVMPCKKCHYIPCHEKNISSFDYSWNRLSKTYDFGSALSGSYGLAPIGALSQWTARAELFFDFFYKIEAKFPFPTTLWA